jgi:hypothetical protein
VAVGGFAIGLGHIVAAAGRSFAGARGAMAMVAGGALLLSMPLAAAWATAAWLGLGFLSLPVMAAVHGGLNVIGFALPATYAWFGARS